MRDETEISGGRGRHMNRWRAFTLIELLIVVAIIAILAAIAVPNFMEAQTRSKVSRVKADIRSLVNSLEAYVVDNNHYPPEPNNWRIDVTRLNMLSTPVAYIATVNVNDPFAAPGGNRSADDQWFWPDSLTYMTYNNYWMAAYNLPMRKACALGSRGPDRQRNGIEHYVVWANHPEVASSDPVNFLYDATNGTRSSGDIGRSTGDVGAGFIPQ